MSVARQGYGLDILIDDPIADVRMEVAEQGYGLDKLVHDSYYKVKRLAKKQLRLQKK